MTEALVCIRSLSFCWNRDKTPLLQIAALDLAAGEAVMLCGPSGSGKSTLLGLLGGVLTPQSGSIKILGQDLAMMTARQRDRFRVDHMGFIFQQFNLVPYLSALQNVLLPCRFARRRAQRASAQDGQAGTLLESIGIGPRLWRKPVTELSVGEQQRVAAARALIGRPELVIADEPTSSLDAQTQQLFLDILFRHCDQSGATLLFVSHDTRLASRFQRQVTLESINLARADDPHR